MASMALRRSSVHSRFSWRMNPWFFPLVLVSMALMGCAEAPLSVSADSQMDEGSGPGRDSSRNAYNGNRLPLTVDGSTAVIDAIVWPQGKPSGLSIAVDWASFFRSEGTGPTFKISRIEATVRIWEREGPYVPDVTVHIDGVDSHGLLVSGTGRSEGPSFRGGMTWTSDSSATQASFAVAFFNAYARALASIATSEEAQH